MDSHIVFGMSAAHRSLYQFCANFNSVYQLAVE